MTEIAIVSHRKIAETMHHPYRPSRLSHVDKTAKRGLPSGKPLSVFDAIFSFGVTVQTTEKHRRVHSTHGAGFSNSLSPQTRQPSRFARCSMLKQNCSDPVNVICDGSPSRMRSVRRISLGMTTRPKSSMRRTMPVAFICAFPPMRNFW